MDLSFVKRKLNSLQGKKDPNFWKPIDGEQQIRIVPYKYNLDNPFIELPLYYFRQPNGNVKTLLSPSFNGNPDPILEYCEKLRSTGDKEKFVFSKKIEPTLRTYVPIIVRGLENEGVKFWGFGKMVYEAILEKMDNPDIGDITRLEDGNDLIVKFSKKPPSGKKYSETKIDVRFKKTPAVDPTSDELINKIQEQVDILTLFVEPTYDELVAELNKILNSRYSSEDSEEFDEDVISSEDKEINEEVEQSSEEVKSETNSSTESTVEVPTEKIENIHVDSPTAEKSVVKNSPEDMKNRFKEIFTKQISK